MCYEDWLLETSQEDGQWNLVFRTVNHSISHKATRSFPFRLNNDTSLRDMDDMH